MIFAQVEGLTQSLSGNGPAWALVSILLTLCWFLIKMLLSEKDKRIEDAKKSQEDLVKPIEDIGKTLERMEYKTRAAKGEQ